jgi:hypothetical protein
VSLDQAQLPQQPSTKELQAFTLKNAEPHRFDDVVCGVRVVVSNALPSSVGQEFEQRLPAAVRDIRPALKPFVPLVVAMVGNDRDRTTVLATAIGDAAIVVWFRRHLWYGGLRQEVSVHTLEHEAAHIVWERTQSSVDAWEAVMREDSMLETGAPVASCLVLQEIADVYDPVEWIKEDWAVSVEWSRAPSFARRFPARARRIGEILPG